MNTFSTTVKSVNICNESRVVTRQHVPLDGYSLHGFAHPSHPRSSPRGTSHGGCWGAAHCYRHLHGRRLHTRHRVTYESRACKRRRTLQVAGHTPHHQGFRRTVTAPASVPGPPTKSSRHMHTPHTQVPVKMRPPPGWPLSPSQTCLCTGRAETRSPRLLAPWPRAG